MCPHYGSLKLCVNLAVMLARLEGVNGTDNSSVQCLPLEYDGDDADDDDEEEEKENMQQPSFIRMNYIIAGWM